MSLEADEISSAILDEGGHPEIDPTLRAAVAQRLFIHGLLLEYHGRASLDSLVSNAFGRRRSRRKTWMGWGSLAAGILFGFLAFALLTGDSVPSAEASVDRLIRTLELPGDLHYAGHLYTGDGADSTLRQELDFYLRRSKWAVTVQRPLGLFRVVGEGQKVWIVTPFHRVLEIPRTGAFLPQDLDPALLAGNLLETLHEIRAGFTFSPVMRETLRDKPVLHIRGMRPEQTPGLRQADLWMEQESGRCIRAELRSEPKGLPARRLVLEHVDSDPRGDALFLLPGPNK